jgi:transcriptional regulator with XRE-family HTH domain
VEQPVSESYDLQPVHPNGLEVRRRRHERGWSRRHLSQAISEACYRSTGLRERLTPNLLSGIEEHNELIPYRILCLLAGGLDCDPVDLILRELSEPPEQ